MAYDILAKDGRPILKDGDPVKAMDYIVEKVEQLDDTNKTFVAVASTEDEDRDKDIIRQNGWDLKNFKKNPMIPWSHDYWGVPIARSLRTWVDHDSKRLLFKPQFDTDDETSMKIFNKYKNGFLTSFSVGFRGIEQSWRDEENHWGGGIEFLKQELLEISAVTIPANPNATINLNSESNFQNLLQLGYPTKFAETEQGLFYPVREELGEFINPEIKVIDGFSGVQAVYAHSISDFNKDEEGTTTIHSTPVGYYFNPDEWTPNDAKLWIEDNVDKSYKFWYYDWKWINDQDSFKIEEIKVEKEIPDYSEPIKLVNTDNVNNGETEDDILEIEKTMEDYLSEINVILEKHLDGISKGVETALEKFLEGLSEIKSLLNEKTVDSNLEIDDNIDDTTDGSEDDKSSNSKSDDQIEIDDSLLSPDNDKTNDDEVIELDEKLLSDKDAVKDAVKTGLNEKLKETLDEVRSAFKIEV
jgi:HK97 family phage prohead protease